MGGRGRRLRRFWRWLFRAYGGAKAGGPRCGEPGAEPRARRNPGLRNEGDVERRLGGWHDAGGAGPWLLSSIGWRLYGNGHRWRRLLALQTAACWGLWARPVGRLLAVEAAALARLTARCAADWGRKWLLSRRNVEGGASGERRTPRRGLQWQTGGWQAAVTVTGDAVVVRVGRLDACFVWPLSEVGVVNLCIVKVLGVRLGGRIAALQVGQPPRLVNGEEWVPVGAQQVRPRLPPLCCCVCAGNPIQQSVEDASSQWLRV